MNRFHIRPEAVRGDRVTFDAEETRHLARVLRLRPGSVVRTVDGRGHELTVRLTRIDRRAAEGEIVARAIRASESPLDLTLAQGIPKGTKLEAIIRMATEIGVARVVPLICDRAVARPEPGELSHRVTRWRRVAKEAAKQSGRAVIPEVRAPISLGDWLVEPPPGLIVCLWEGERAPLSAVLPDETPSRATVVVGPEGGLADGEVERLRSAGALIAVALLQSRYGDLGGSP